jgi:hypothetical protein
MANHAAPNTHTQAASNLLTAGQMAVKTEWHRETDGRRLYLILVVVTCDGPNDQLAFLLWFFPEVFPSRPSCSPEGLSRQQNLCGVPLVFSRSNLVMSAKRLCASLEFLIVALLLLLTTLLSTNVSIGHR